MTKWISFISVVVILGISLSCSSSSKHISPSSQKSSSDNYTTAFPQRDISAQLEQAHRSILRIVTTDFYNTYTFEENFVTLADIKTNNPKDIATQFFSTEESTAGTSIVLRYNDDKVLLITCDHVVSSPDTTVAYFEGENIPNNTYVKSISIKQRENKLIFTSHQLHNFDVIARNSRTDLALLVAELEDQMEPVPRPLDFSLGKSENMQMGSFLYVLGYPRGYPIVTRGLASTSDNLSSRFFITDALFNPGISGGLVLASNDNFESLQWTGMARSATASKEDVLIPQPDSDRYSQVAKPYPDTAFVQKKTRINYGITQTIPINTIKKFLAEHQSEISRNGFNYSVDEE